MISGLTSNLAGLAVVLLGAIAYRGFARKRILSPANTPAPKSRDVGQVLARIKEEARVKSSRVMRFAGVTLLLAMIAATSVTLADLRTAPLLPIRISLPTKPVSPEAADAHLITALLVRENDGRVVRAWEKVVSTNDDTLTFSTPEQEYPGDIMVSIIGPRQYAHPQIRATFPSSSKYRYAYSGNAVALNAGAAFIPDGKFSSFESGNLFSLITRGGPCHLLCFATPVKSGVVLATTDADDVVRRLDWLRAPIRTTSREAFHEIESRIPERDGWKAAHSTDSRHAEMTFPGDMFGAHFGTGGFVLLLFVSFLPIAGTRYAPLRFLACLCAMLGAAVLAEHTALRIAADKGAVHRFFTADSTPR